ncbi:MAG TPA: glycosyltransferase family 39 protein [Thermoanaerobaculia bacterium]|nr:glycosyltransferase family 39 protein [Thermoanaerobaculia bacterium]
MRRWQQLACVAIAVALCAARFVRLNDTPAGFYLDEAAGAATMLCIDEPRLFFEEFPGTGTFFTPAYVYSGAAWAKLFGSSIASFRSHVAFYSVLTIVALFLVARHFLGLDGALFAALAAAVSPWGFPFARIAWDPPLAPCFAMWGVFFFLRKHAVLAGLLFAAAMYTYPPARLHVPLILLVLVLNVGRASARLDGLKPALRSALAMLVACIPLIVLTLNGTLSARANALAVWSTEAPFTRFAQNLLAHLSPDFLLFKGDLNPRHGTQLFGILSWLDVLAILAGVWLLKHINRKLLVLAAAGFLGALAVASLTWEGVPHALRSLTGWPFLALLTGALLSAACARWRVVPYLALACALAFSIVFLNVYFTTYRTASAPFFDAVLREEAEEGDFEALRGYWAFYPRPALRYYFLYYGGLPCASLRGDDLPPLPAGGHHRP